MFISAASFEAWNWLWPWSESPPSANSRSEIPLQQGVGICDWSIFGSSEALNDMWVCSWLLFDSPLYTGLGRFLVGGLDGTGQCKAEAVQDRGQDRFPEATDGAGVGGSSDSLTPAILKFGLSSNVWDWLMLSGPRLCSDSLSAWWEITSPWPKPCALGLAPSSFIELGVFVSWGSCKPYVNSRKSTYIWGRLVLLRRCSGMQHWIPSVRQLWQGGPSSALHRTFRERHDAQAILERLRFSFVAGEGFILWRFYRTI